MWERRVKERGCFNLNRWPSPFTYCLKSRNITKEGDLWVSSLKGSEQVNRVSTYQKKTIGRGNSRSRCKPSVMSWTPAKCLASRVTQRSKIQVSAQGSWRGKKTSAPETMGRQLPRAKLHRSVHWKTSLYLHWTSHRPPSDTSGCPPRMPECSSHNSSALDVTQLAKSGRNSSCSMELFLTIRLSDSEQ